MVTRPSITQVRFRLRKQLIDRLQRAANASDRSLNDEVIARLDRSFTRDVLERYKKEIGKAVAEDRRLEQEEVEQAQHLEDRMQQLVERLEQVAAAIERGLKSKEGN
jgi:hypothetical protein